MYHTRSADARLVGVLVAVTLVLLAGCSTGPEARFVDDNRDYTLAEVAENAAGMDPGKSASVKVDDASEVRQRVLSRLRGHGEVAGKAADALTRGFPSDVKAVPFHVEAAEVDGAPSWIVVETWGGRSGSLTYRRLWVIDRATGDITESRTFR